MPESNFATRDCTATGVSTPASEFEIGSGLGDGRRDKRARVGLLNLHQSPHLLLPSLFQLVLPLQLNMVVKLVGSPISTCTKRAVLVLLEKKVDFEFVPIDFSKGEHKAPEFVAKQPFGQVPYLVSLLTP